jgi:glycosyltransferase involved in cell wall biosynthesis
MDIGIMPLPDEPWARGKSGYKLIQYGACGLPVVASPVGVNAEIVVAGETGFTASNGRQWRDALTRLITDAKLRRQMGRAGRMRIEQRYSLEAHSSRFVEVIRRAVEAS